MTQCQLLCVCVGSESVNESPGNQYLSTTFNSFMLSHTATRWVITVIISKHSAFQHSKQNLHEPLIVTMRRWHWHWIQWSKNKARCSMEQILGGKATPRLWIPKPRCSPCPYHCLKIWTKSFGILETLRLVHGACRNGSKSPSMEPWHCPGRRS